MEPTLTGVRFLGALAGAAATGALLQRGGGAAKAQGPTAYYYEDSFGNILPCSPDTIAAGILPPPIPGQGANPQDVRRPVHPHRGSHRLPHPDDSPDSGSGCSGDPCPAGTTCVTAPNRMNILMIMVDQMRAPRWVPSSQSLATLLPNITQLQNMSFVFSNYFVAATACSPSRATLLTGLYSRQTCMFVTEDPGSPYPPSLQPWVQNSQEWQGVSPQRYGGAPEAPRPLFPTLPMVVVVYSGDGEGVPATRGRPLAPPVRAPGGRVRQPLP